jgi:hypothetical protein
MSKVIWIVFFGVRGSGKSTLGEYLAQHLEFKVDAFANPLKRAAQLIFGFTDKDLYGSSTNRETQYPGFLNTGWCHACHMQCVSAEAHIAVKETKLSILTHPWYCESCEERYPLYVNPRHALKTLGTEWGRHICMDIWIQSMFANNVGVERLAVTDGRFINENQACLERCIHRVLLTRGLKDSTDPHPSEAEVRYQAQQPKKYFDFILHNEGQALEQTKAQLHAYVSTLIGD